MVDRKLTGAHYGLRDWAMQRITAVVMLIYTVIFSFSCSDCSARTTMPSGRNFSAKRG